MYKILIAEDETRIASFVAKGLQKHGFYPEIASDGEQALQLLENTAFDLLLLDINLPLKDGWTVLSELRANKNFIPIIIVTACYDFENNLANLPQVIPCVSKPFSFADLLSNINAILLQKSPKETHLVKFS